MGDMDEERPGSVSVLSKGLAKPVAKHTNLLQKMSAQETKRSEVTELRTLLRSPDVQRDPRRYLQAVQKVIACMTLGIDVSKLFSEMIMAGATTDLVQKKLVYLYLSNYAESNSEVALLTVNTLQKDCQDRNPVVRGLALRSMCSLRLPNILEYLREPLQAGLGDRSSYVRKTAVMGIVKLFHVAPEFIEELNLVDVLYQMLRDRDPQVVSNCISALSEILANEGGMVVNAKITHYFLNRLKDFSEWGQCQVLDLLRRYEPSSEDDLFDVLNVLDDRLKHANSGVVLGGIHLFLHLTNNMPHLLQDVYDRIKSPVLTILGSGSSEVIYTCLQHVQLLLARQPDMWSSNYQNFFCRYNDPPYVKVKKLEVLTEVCNVENAQNIVDELGEYATDVNVLVARKAIQAIGKIALRVSARANTCADKLVSLLSMEIDYVTAETLVSLANILRRFENTIESIIPQLPTTFDDVTDSDGKAALIWILGEYGESLNHAPYMLEELVKNISEESSSSVKLQLLSAVMKMFFKRPPECQEMLGTLLEHSIDEEGDMDVHDRGVLYYRLLKHDVKEAQKVVCGQTKTVVETNTVIPRLSLFPEFNTLSTMYGELSTNFIIQECPYVISEGSASRGTEPNFDLMESSSQVSSTDGISPQPSPRMTRQDIPIPGFTDEQLVHIEVPRAPFPGEPPIILLSPKPTLSAGDFEKKWLAMDKMLEHQLHLSYVPPPKELERAMAARFIMMMASSAPDQPLIKFFFYAQHVSTLDLFLMEANLVVASASLSFTVKCDNPKHTSNFVKHFLQTLVAQGWLSKP